MKKCIYCDTIYADTDKNCPLCGGTAFEQVGDVSPIQQEEYNFDDELDRTIAEIKAEEDPLTAAAAVATASRPDDTKQWKPRRSKERTSTPAAAPVQKKEPEWQEQEAVAVPKWMTALICLVLCAALLVGLAFVAYTLGLFEKKESKPQEESLSLPYDTQSEQQTETQEPEQQPVEQEPEQQDPQPQEPETKPDPVQEPEQQLDAQEPAQQEPEQQPDEKEPEQQPEDQEPEQQPEPQPQEPVNLSCTSLSLNLTDVTLSSKGETFKLRATVEPENCTDELTFTSADTSYVTVEKDGERSATVTGVNGKRSGNVIGTVMVTARCGNQSQQCIIRLNFADREPSTTSEGDNSSSFSLNLTDFTMQFKGEEVAVEVNGMNLAKDSVTWSIGDTSIATIRSNKDTCIVTAVKTGSTTLTATVNGNVVLKCIVRCGPKVSGS